MQLLTGQEGGFCTMNYDAEARRSLERIAQTQPLIHQITNLVVTNDSANLTLGFGALPVMAYAPEEVAEMAALSQALVLNIGTLSVGEIAAMAEIPIVLDPVGAGATQFRTESALRLLHELPITLLRGNRGEIGALLGSGAVRGVEAVGREDPAKVAVAASARFGVTTAVTGAVDVVVDGERALYVHNGDPMLARITGSGCMATAAIGIFLTAGDDPLLQAALALASYGLAAERAAVDVPGPGTFRARLLDEVAALATKGITGLRITPEPAATAATPNDGFGVST
jgi:hydroxyethylthiazole kinase